MVDSNNQVYKSIDVTSVSHNNNWSGIPVVKRLTKQYMGTLSPSSDADGQVFLMLSIFDVENPFLLTKVASCPVH